MILNTSSLTRNRKEDKFFGIDYYVNLCIGSDKRFNYLSTPLDFNPLANNKTIVFSQNLFADFISKSKDFNEKKIFGLFQNPDIYSVKESIGELIKAIRQENHGLFIESDSLNMLNDIEELESLSRDDSLLIGIPIMGIDPVNLSIFDQQPDFKQIERLVKSIKKHKIKFGFIIKPIIPKVNDNISLFKKMIHILVDLEPDFIYPTFSLNFDSKKLNSFYEVIDKEKSELKSYFTDFFGYKTSWITENANELKKQFIFNIKKTKICYSMTQIIDLYKTPNQDKQISLF